MQSTQLQLQIPITIKSNYEFKQVNFEKNFLKILKQLGFSSMEDIKQQDFHFDLSNSYYYDLGTLLWMITLFHQLKKQKNELQLTLPNISDEKGQRVWNFLIRWEFFRALENCVDSPVNMLKPEQVPLTGKTSNYLKVIRPDEYGNEVQLYSNRLLEITDVLESNSEEGKAKGVDKYVEKWQGKVVLGALSNLCGWTRQQALRFIHEVIGEGLYNSVFHAAGTFCLIAMNVDPQNLSLAIVDNGQGIPDTLRSTFIHSEKKSLIENSDSQLIRYYTDPELIHDSEWITFSTRKGTTSRAGKKGFGLYYLKQLVLGYGGELRIRSGRANVDFFPDKDPDSVDNLFMFSGTLIRVRTPRKKDV